MHNLDGSIIFCEVKEVGGGGEEEFRLSTAHLYILIYKAKKKIFPLHYW